jgi:HEAT repeat protein
MNDIRKLLCDLKNQSDPVRLNAVKALATHKEAEIVDHLIDLLSDYNPDIRTAAAITMSKIGNERAVNPLIKALSDTNKDTRVAVAMALGKIGDFRAITHLRTLQRLDLHEDVRKTALIALEEIDRAIIPMLKEIGQELGSPHLEDRRRAIKFLTTIGTKDSAALLVKAIGNSSEEVRTDALEGLDKLLHLGSEPFLKGLKDENWKIRISCVEFLGKMKNEEVVGPLIDLLDDENTLEVKKTIASVLGRLKAEDSLYNLRNMVSKDEPELNKILINSIVDIGGPQAIEFLVRILIEEEGDTAVLAEESLCKFGYKIIPVLIEDYSSENDKGRNTIKKVIKHLGGDGVDYFLQLLGDPEPDKRKLAIEFLGELEAKNSIDALTELAEEDSDKTVKTAASRVLNKLKRKFKMAGGPSFIPSDSLLQRFSTFFSDQIEKISKVKGPSLSNFLKSDKLRCTICGGIISRKASFVEYKGQKLDVMRFGKCPLCEKILCKNCCHTIVVRGLTSIKCPNCNVELDPA